MKNYNANELLKKYQLGQCSEEELNIIESWYNAHTTTHEDLNLDDIFVAKKNVWKQLPVHQAKKPLKLWYLSAIAASLILVAGIGLTVFSNKNKQDVNLDAYSSIKPGSNRATLKLADGKEILLNDLQNGQVLKQEGIKITKTENGQLIYTALTDIKQTIPAFNTISTPTGGTYQVILPDGTKVWLNAASLLKYPTIFEDAQRVVELSGEAYFEVAHNASKPFKVKTDKQTVTVLGTHFNLSAYSDDNFSKTTLYEGKVEVNANKNEAVLQPSEQAILANGALKVKAITNDSDLAWKNNEFSFFNEPLDEILKKLGRWYDVEFVCQDDLKNLQFGGFISRDKNLKQALNIIDQEGTVHFKIEGRKITAMR